MKVLEIAGSVASVSSLVIALYFQWQGKPDLQRNLALATGFAFLAVTFVAYLQRRKTDKSSPTATSKPDSKFGILSGVIRVYIPENSEYEVFYKRLFKRKPHLEIEKEYLSGAFELLQQRRDGFKIASRDYHSLYLKWKAEGEFSEDN